MHKISDLSESSTIDFQITGRGNVTPEIHSFLSRYENFNKLLKKIMLSMRPHLMRSIFCALLCLWGGLAMAEGVSDPFDTEAALPLTPALRQGGAIGDPCAEAMPDGALDLLEGVHLALF